MKPEERVNIDAKRFQVTFIVTRRQTMVIEATALDSIMADQIARENLFEKYPDVVSAISTTVEEI